MVTSRDLPPRPAAPGRRQRGSGAVQAVVPEDVDSVDSED